MKYFHNIKIRVFCDTDEKESIIMSLKKFTENEKLEIKEEIAEGFDEKEIIIISATISKQKEIKIVLEKIKENNHIVHTLHQQYDSRVDDACKFFIRFDKDSFLADKLELTDSGNCIHLTCAVATFPQKKEVALTIVKNLFS